MDVDNITEKYRDFFENSNYDVLRGLAKNQYYLIEYEKERGIVDFFVEVDQNNIENVIEALVAEDMDIFFDAVADKIQLVRRGIEVDKIDEELMKRFKKNLKLFEQIGRLINKKETNTN